MRKQTDLLLNDAMMLLVRVMDEVDTDPDWARDQEKVTILVEIESWVQAVLKERRRLSGQVC